MNWLIIPAGLVIILMLKPVFDSLHYGFQLERDQYDNARRDDNI